MTAPPVAGVAAEPDLSRRDHELDAVFGGVDDECLDEDRRPSVGDGLTYVGAYNGLSSWSTRNEHGELYASDHSTPSVELRPKPHAWLAGHPVALLGTGC